MSTTTDAGFKPVEFSLSYKFTWGLAALGTSLISGIYGAMLPIFYQDYLGLAARWIAIASAAYDVFRISAFTAWVPVHFCLAIACGWFGGWLVSRHPLDEEL